MRPQEILPRLERRLTIRVRLTIWYVVLLAIILAAFSGLLYFSMDRGLYLQNEALLRAHVEQILGQMEVENGQIRWPEPEPPTSAGTLASLYNQDGERIIGPRASKVFPDHLQHVKQTVNKLQKINLQEGDALVITVPVLENGRTVGWLVAMRSLEPIEDTMLRLLLLLLLAIPLTLVVAVGGGLFLSRRALSPIDRLTRIARDISYTNLSQRFAWLATPDEVGRLAATFDEMLERLEKAFQRERQFTADASHELRTPVAVIYAQAEEALRQPGIPEDNRKALETILEQAARMGKMISQLLDLARTDARQVPLQREELDLATLVWDVAEEMRELAEKKGLEYQVALNEPVTVRGDQTRLTQLFINLIDNAISYTPQGGRISVAVGRAGGMALVAVTDTGTGIPATDLPHIFERFYRVDKARSRAQGGTGLGLAIAKSIVEAHDGRVEVKSQPGEGTAFLVSLPCLER